MKPAPGLQGLRPHSPSPQGISALEGLHIELRLTPVVQGRHLDERAHLVPHGSVSVYCATHGHGRTVRAWSSALFCFEALDFDGAVETRPAERAPTRGQRIVRHILAVASGVVALAVSKAYGLHQLGRCPVNRPVVRQERAIHDVGARNVEHRTDAGNTVYVDKSVAAARPKLEVAPRIRREPSERQGRVDVLRQDWVGIRWGLSENSEDQVRITVMGGGEDN